MARRRIGERKASAAANRQKSREGQVARQYCDAGEIAAVEAGHARDYAPTTDRMIYNNNAPVCIEV